MDVLIGLGCNGALVSKMWHFLWLMLGLDVNKILQAAKAMPTKGVAKTTAGGASTSSKGSMAISGSAQADEGGSQLFCVLTLCCQATQYRLV